MAYDPFEDFETDIFEEEEKLKDRATRVLETAASPQAEVVARPEISPDKLSREAQRGFAINSRLVDWLEGDDGRNAALVADDLETVGSLAWWAKAGLSAFTDGMEDQMFGQLVFDEATGRSGYGDAELLAELRARRSTREGADYGADNWLERSFVEAARVAPTTVGGIYSGAKGAAIGALLGGAAGFTGGLLLPAVGDETALALAGAKLGAKWGTRVGASWYIFQVEAGLAYDELSREVDEDGKPLDQDILLGAALLVGMANAGLEYFSLTKFVKGFGPAGELVLGRITIAEARQLLKTITFRQAARNMVRRWFTTIGTEVTTEVLQESTVILASDLSKDLANARGARFHMDHPSEPLLGALPTEPFASMWDLAANPKNRDRLIATAAQTFGAMLWLGAPGPHMSFMHEAWMAKNAKQNADFLASLGDSAGSLKLLEKLPEKARELVKALREDGPVSHLFVPVEEFDRAAKEAGFKPEELAREITGGDTAYKDANRDRGHGGDLMMQLEDYVSKVAATKLHTELFPHLRAAQGAMTLAEKIQWLRSVGPQADALIKETALTRQQAQEIYTDIYTKLVTDLKQPERRAASNARLWQQFFVVMANRMGMTPTDLYKRYTMHFEQQLPEQFKQFVMQKQFWERTATYTGLQLSALAERQASIIVANALGALPKAVAFARKKRGPAAKSVAAAEVYRAMYQLDHLIAAMLTAKHPHMAIMQPGYLISLVQAEERAEQTLAGRDINAPTLPVVSYAELQQVDIRDRVRAAQAAAEVTLPQRIAVQDLIAGRQVEYKLPVPPNDKRFPADIAIKLRIPKQGVNAGRLLADLSSLSGEALPATAFGWVSDLVPRGEGVTASPPLIPRLDAVRIALETLWERYEAATTGRVLDAIEEERRFTDNPNFEAWFRHGVLVDENGQPLPVFHYTRATEPFGVFSDSYDIGFHFGNYHAARDRAQHVHEIGDAGERASWKLMAFYASLQNPLRVPDMGAWNSDSLLAHLIRRGVIRMSDVFAWRGESSFLNPLWLVERDQQARLGRPDYATHEGLIYRNMDLGGNLEEAMALGGVIVMGVRALAAETIMARHAQGEIATAPLTLLEPMVNKWENLVQARPELREHINEHIKPALPRIMHQMIIDILRQKGYDGLVYENEVEGGGDSYVVFVDKPQMIKSADRNTGQFGRDEMVFYFQGHPRTQDLTNAQLQKMINSARRAGAVGKDPLVYRWARQNLTPYQPVATEAEAAPSPKLTKRQKTIADKMLSSGVVVDHIDALYSSGATDALATNLGLNTVTAKDISALREYFAYLSQSKLPVQPIRVWRAGSIRSDVVSVTTDREVARRFSERYGRSEEIQEFLVDPRFVVGSSDIAKGTFAESELLVRAQGLKPAEAAPAAAEPPFRIERIDMEGAQKKSEGGFGGSRIKWDVMQGDDWVERFDSKKAAQEYIAKKESALAPAEAAPVVAPAKIVAGRVLDFGSGKTPVHAFALREQGFLVDAYDLAYDPYVHVPLEGGLYNTVLASNVLNVQPNETALRVALNQIVFALHPSGIAIANYPNRPREAGIATARMRDILREYFKDVEQVGGTKAGPVWKLSGPITVLRDDKLVRPSESQAGADMDQLNRGAKADGVILPPPDLMMQLDDLPSWRALRADWMREHGYTEEQITKELQLMEGFEALLSSLNPAETVTLPVGANLATKALQKRPGIWGPVRVNSDKSYILSFDAAAMCLKRLEAAATASHIQRITGWTLSDGELLALTMALQQAGRLSPCIACFVESARATAQSMVDKALNSVFDNAPVPAGWSQEVAELVGRAKQEVETLGVARNEIDPSVVLDAIVAASPEGLEQAKRFPLLHELMADRVRAAQANAPKLYEQYRGQFLEVLTDMIEAINHMGGIRFFSSSDFQFEHVIDLVMAMQDLALRKAFAQAYIKVPEFADIFGANGTKTNCSIMAEMGPNGEILESPQGMAWERAKALSEKFPDVGTVLVITSDEMMEWALDQGWIHYMLPYHRSGMRKKYFAALGWKDYTREYGEKWIEPRGVVPSGLKWAVVKQAVISRHATQEEAAAARRKIMRGREKVKPGWRFVVRNLGTENKPRWAVTTESGALSLHEKRSEAMGAADPSVHMGDYLPMQKNVRRGISDAAALKLYRAYCKKKGVKPAFERWISHPNAFKLIKYYARTDTDQHAVTPDFDMQQAMSVLRRYFAGEAPEAEANLPLAAKLIPVFEKARNTGQDVGLEAIEAFKQRQPITSRIAPRQAPPAAPDLMAQIGGDRVETPEAKLLQKYADEGRFEPNTCFKNSGVFAAKVDGDYIEGVIIGGYPRRRIYHAWVERGGIVYDPSLNLALPKERYAKIFTVSEVYRALGIVAAAAHLRNGVWGPLGKIPANFAWQGDALVDTTPPEAYLQAAEEEMKEAPMPMRGYFLREPGTDIMHVGEVAKTANLSTFLHESGHMFFEIMADLAETEGAPEDIRADVAAMLRFAGVSSREDLSQRVAELKERYRRGEISEEEYSKLHPHEKLARAFERYLFEGKVPNAELRGLFERFKEWLKLIYKAIAPHYEISDELRGVFDRMLATDEQIEYAKEVLNKKPMPRSQEELGMTEKQYAVYLENFEKAREEMEDQARIDAMAEATQDKLNKRATMKLAVEPDAREQVLKERPYRTLYFLKNGKYPKGQDAPEGLKKMRRLSAVEATRRWGIDGMRQLEQLGVVFAQKGGQEDFDGVANLLGYQNADEMRQEIVAAQPFNLRLAREVTERVDAAIGPVSPQAVSEAVIGALHGDRWGQVLEAEARFLGRAAGRVAPPRAEIRRMLAAQVEEKRFLDLSEDAYLRAEQKASRETEKALAKGDNIAAFEAKLRQMRAHELWSITREMRQRGFKIFEYLRSMSKDSTRLRLAKAGTHFVDAMDALLEKVELRKASKKAIAKKVTLRQFVEQMQAENRDVVIPDEFLDETVVENWKELTIGRLQALEDAAKNIAHLARLEREFLHGEDARQFEEVVEELLFALRTNVKDRGARPWDRATERWHMRMSGILRNLDAELLKVEQLCKWLDGNQPDGPWMRSIFNPIAIAQGREDDMTLKFTKKFMEILEELPADRRKRLSEAVTIQSIRQPMTLGACIAIALNTGNASNLAKLMKGGFTNEFDKQEALTEDALREILGKLSREDWMFCQRLWNMLEELWPDMEALERRLTGLAPKHIERARPPFELPNLPDEVVGGYWPVVYDPEQSGDMRATFDEASTTQTLFVFGYGRAMTPHGHLKDRVAGFAKPMLVDFSSVLTRHMQQAIHDLTHRESVIAVYRLLRDGDLANALRRQAGEPYYQAMVDWLKAVANERVFENERNSRWWGRQVGTLRANATMVAMGFKATTMLSQLAGLSSSMEVIGSKWVAEGVRMLAHDRGAAVAFVMESSAEMRHRTRNVERDTRGALRRLLGQTKPLSGFKTFAYQGIGYMDMCVSVPTWLGAYKKHIKLGLSHEKAVLEADSAVRLSQGSGATKDLAAVQRSKMLKLFTMFFSYWSALYSRSRTWGRDVAIEGRAIGKGKIDPAAWGKLLARSWFMWIIPALVSELLAGRPPDDDKDETWASWTITKIGVYPFLSIPLLRDVAAGIERGFDRGGYRISPIASAGEKILRTVQGTYKLAAGEDLSEEQFVRDAFEAVSYAVGLPAGQVRATGGYLYDVWERDIEPEHWYDWIYGLLFGKELPEEPPPLF